MSFKCMTWASEQKTGSSTRKLILLMLADRANESGSCYPSQKRLSQDCELSRETVNRQIKELEKLGLLKIIHREKDGVKLPNLYQLNLQGAVTESHSGSDGKPQGVVTESQRGSDGKSHKPIIEPVIKEPIKEPAKEKNAKKSRHTDMRFRVIVQTLRDKVQLKSKIKNSDEEYEAYLELKDTSTLIEDYISHIATKGEYAKNFQNFLLDYNPKTLDQQVQDREVVLWA